MIKINDLCFGYRKTPVFQNISLNFEPGNIYGLLGENGVGKTTLLKLICGLLQPESGTSTVDDMTSSERLPQMLQDIFFLTAETTLPSGRKTTPLQHFDQLSPFYPRANKEEFLEMMKELEVDPNRPFREMSFGQSKKSMIALALAMGTRYLFFDEPTNGLDIPSKTALRSILSKRVDDDTTIIISTHQVKDVENLIDPIIILTQDDVLLNASVGRISEKLAFSYDNEPQPDALYSEQRPGGYFNVRANHDGEDSQLDIEALFNTVLRNKQAIKNLFNE